LIFIKSINDNDTDHNQILKKCKQFLNYDSSEIDILEEKYSTEFSCIFKISGEVL